MTAPGIHAEIEAERDYLVDRICTANDLADRSDLIGRSSTAMLAAALTGEPVTAEPLDVWDLNRCERTYERAPAHLQAAMLPTLERFRAKVLGRTEDWHRDAVRDGYRPAAKDTA